MDTLEQTLSSFELSAEQFQVLVEKLERIIEVEFYIASIQLVILALISVGCGILLTSIFSKYFRGR